MGKIDDATNYAMASNKLEENTLTKEQVEFIKEMLIQDDEKDELVEKTLKLIKESKNE